MSRNMDLIRRDPTAPQVQEEGLTEEQFGQP